jgi:hypothetical protein
MSDGVGWAEPPPLRGPAYDWEAIARKCRRQPGRWRKVFEQDRFSLAVAIRQGSIAALRPESGFEVRTANTTSWRTGDGPRMCSMWVRYNPDKEQ